MLYIIAYLYIYVYMHVYFSVFKDIYIYIKKEEGNVLLDASVWPVISPTLL